MSAPQSLLAELDSAVRCGSAQARVQTMRRITDLLLADVDRLNEQQIDVFDDVLSGMIEYIETKARAELSRRLAPVENAPLDVIRRLASDDEIVVAEPVLRLSPRLSSSDLVQIARHKGQDHLFAITERSQLDETVTSVLIDRGDTKVLRSLAGHAQAQFSDQGYAEFVKRAAGDETLTEKLGLRLDIPIRFLRELLLRATEAVRNRLLASSKSETHSELQKLLASIANDVLPDAPTTRDYEPAIALVRRLQSQRALTETKLFDFAVDKRFVETVVTIALMSSAHVSLIDELMTNSRTQAILVPCKAINLNWQTVQAILRLHPTGALSSEHVMASLATEYRRLSDRSAERVLRFWQARHVAAA